MCSLGAEGIGVPVVTLDKLVNDGTIPPPSVMKIDVEGAEERVLTGAYRLLTTAFPLIFLSAHGYRQHEACRDYLSELGYELQLRRDGNRDGQYEVTAKHPAAVV